MINAGLEMDLLNLESLSSSVCWTHGRFSKQLLDFLGISAFAICAPFRQIQYLDIMQYVWDFSRKTGICCVL